MVSETSLFYIIISQCLNEWTIVKWFVVCNVPLIWAHKKCLTLHYILLLESRGFTFGGGVCYYISTEYKTWDDSRAFCAAKQSDLITIKSREKQVQCVCVCVCVCVRARVRACVLIYENLMPHIEEWGQPKLQSVFKCLISVVTVSAWAYFRGGLC